MIPGWMIFYERENRHRARPSHSAEARPDQGTREETSNMWTFLPKGLPAT
jgi:hypothetical protein